MVTKKPKGLGRGLDALLGPTLASSGEGDAATPAGTPMMLALEAMAPGQYQPRTRMDEGALYELAESIKAQGIMQPILVRRLQSKAAPVQAGQARAATDFAASYEIIAGERRWASRVPRKAIVSPSPAAHRCSWARAGRSPWRWNCETIRRTRCRLVTRVGWCLQRAGTISTATSERICAATPRSRRRCRRVDRWW